MLTLSKKIIPGRVSLKDTIGDHFRTLMNSGIANLGDLLNSLSSSEKIRAVAGTTGIPQEYLILLRREAGSYLVRPISLSDFPGIPYEYIEVLKTSAIRHTRDFFELVQTKSQRQSVAERTGIPEARLDEIFALCNLTRISGIGGIFARIFYDAGTRSVEDFACIEPRVHLEKYNVAIRKYRNRPRSLTEADMRFFLEYAKVIAG